MMTRHYRVIATAFIVTLALLIAPGVSLANRMQGGQRGMMSSDMMSQLSPEEQKVAQDIFQKHHGKLMDLHKKIFAKRAELNALMAQEKFDGQKARTMVKELASLESELTQNHLGVFIEMREKGVSYYGTCMIGGQMGPCATGVGMGRGMMGQGMMGQGMMDGGKMMDQGTKQPAQK